MGLRFNMTTWVYVAYAVDGKVVYVGISSQPKYRIKEHRRNSKWFKFADRFELIKCENRFEAERKEGELIALHTPQHNLQKNPKYKRDGYAFVRVAA